MKNAGIIILVVFINAFLCYGADERFIINNNIQSPADRQNYNLSNNNNNLKKTNNSPSHAVASVNNIADNTAAFVAISPFYPAISEYSLDNGFSISNSSLMRSICYIDIASSQLVLRQISENNSLSEKIVVCPVQYDLSNGSDFEIFSSNIYIVLKEYDKLYFIKDAASCAIY